MKIDHNSFFIIFKKNREDAPNPFWLLVKMLQPNTYIQYNNLRIRNVLILVFYFLLIFEVFWGRELAIKTDEIDIFIDVC